MWPRIMLTGTVMSSSCFMHCSRCILSWIKDKIIMHNCPLFQTSKARLLKKQNEKQGSSFQFFKPGNSLIP